MPEYFTLAELRALPDMGQARYTDERVESVAAYVVAVIERVVGVSFVARSTTRTLDGSGGSSLALPHAYVTSVTAVAFDGVAQTVGDFSVEPGGLLCSTGTFPSGSRNVSVTYGAGYSTAPPADIKEAALQATRARLMETDSNAVMHDRRSSTSSDGSTTTFVLPGSDRPFGYPSVDAVVIGWRDHLAGFGFA